MKVSCLLPVRTLVTVLAGILASCSAGYGAEQVPQKAERPTEHSVNIQRIKTLDCKGPFICRQETLLFITGDGKGYCLDLGDDPSSPVVLSDSLPHAWDIAVKDKLAFVAANTQVLTVYDMADGKTWRKIAECRTPSGPENVIVRDDLAYVAGCVRGFQIIDIRDPKNPAIVGENKVSKQDIDAIGLVGHVAYLYDHLHGSLRLVDVTDPANSKHLSLFKYGHPFIQGEMDVCCGFAYCVAGDHGVVIVDVRDSMAPKLAAAFDTPGHARDVIVSNGFAFVADGEGGIRVADVHNPGKPVEVGYFTSPDLNAQQLAVLGNLVYVANKPPQRAIIFRFDPPSKVDSQGRQQGS